MLAGASRLWGYTPFVMRTGSMAPQIPAGSLLFARPTDRELLTVGDIVAFTPGSAQPILVHRIVEIRQGSQGPLFATKGDQNPSPDPGYVSLPERPLKVYSAIPYLGYVYGQFTSLRPSVLLAIGAGLLLMGWAAMHSSRGRSGPAPTTSTPPRRGSWPPLAGLALVLTLLLLAPGLCVRSGLGIFTDQEPVGNNTLATAPGFGYFFHSETTAVGGNTYYQLKKHTPADGMAATISSTFSPGQTGRHRPSPNSGKFLYPLTGLSQLPASTWQVTYRISRDKANRGGFVWFTNAADISLSTTGSWQNIDLSPHVPVGATGAIVEVVNTHKTKSYRGMVRGTEDGNNYMAEPTDGEIKGREHRWQVVKVDSSRRIQGFISSTRVDFKLLGYTRGDDPVYFTTPPDVTPGTIGSWATVDVSAIVDADATGVILLVYSASEAPEVFGIREVGSSYSTTSLNLDARHNTMYMVGLDPNGHFQAYLSSPDVRLYLVAQTKGSVVYYVNDVTVADPPTGSWQTMDADDYAVPFEANGLVFLVESTATRDIGFRHGDSNDDWNKQIGANTHIQAAIGISSNNQWDERMGGTEVNVFIVAYTLGVVQMDVHADMDVIIRRADGSVRQTLATNVANTPNITGTGWQTFTVTYSFPGYTVVDPTDYLEMDLFAEATSNTSEESVSVQFRIDDSTLPVDEQTRARES